MIANHRSQERTANVAIGLALVVLTATAAFTVAVPMPTTEGMAKDRRDQEFQMRLQTQEARERLATSQTEISRWVWPAVGSEISQKVLEQVSSAAKERKLQLVSLRPQRPDEAGDLSVSPFLVTVEGPYPQAIAFVRELEKPERKLAINLLQIGSVDGATDVVSVSVGLGAYALPEQGKSEVARG